MSFFVTATEFTATAEKVAKLNQRAAKAGIAATVTLTEIARETKTEKNDFGFDRTYVVVEAELTGLEAVKLGDWTVAATLDHDAAGNIFRTNPGFGQEIPAEFRGTDATRCDHCNTRRLRNQTVVVFSETEGFKQVGSDCVKLFLGVSASSLIAFFEDAAEINEFEGGRYGRTEYSVTEFVAAAALVTEFYGFVPRSAFNGQPTADVTTSLLRNDNFFRTNHPELAALVASNEGKIVERANVLAAEALAWIATESGSEYIVNMKLAAARELVGRNEGLLASLPNAHKRHLGQVAERTAKAALPASEFVGAKGDKITTKATPIYTNRSAGFSYYGPDSLFVILLGEDGSKFYLNTTVETAVGVALEDAAKGTYFTVTGTVKDHKLTDKGDKVTVITRCKAQEV